MISEDDDDANLTASELLARGARLGFFCDACGRFRYLPTDHLPEDQIAKAIA
jgi:hypothetical protein